MPVLTIVVANATRCRFYTYDRRDRPPAEDAPALRERLDLVDPERRLRPSQRHGERAGTSLAPTGLAFGVDDHRDEHEHELDRRFAATIASELTKLVHEMASSRVALIASPHMLGLLRPLAEPLVSRGIEVHTEALDLTLESTPELHDHLARLGVIGPRATASAS